MQVQRNHHRLPRDQLNQIAAAYKNAAADGSTLPGTMQILIEQHKVADFTGDQKKQVRTAIDSLLGKEFNTRFNATPGELRVIQNNYGGQAALNKVAYLHPEAKDPAVQGLLAQTYATLMNNRDILVNAKITDKATLNGTFQEGLRAIRGAAAK